MRVPTRPLARASPFPTAMSLDDAHAAFVELPPCSKSIVVGAIVVGLILNPIFGLDDVVAFCPLDVLRRGQFHRLLTSALHVDGPIATVACCVVAIRIIAPWERHRGTLRAAFDGAAATLFVNVASIAFAVLAAPFAPNVFKPNFLGDSGALVATFTVFVRETTRAPANVDAAAHFGGTISAKRAPTAAAVVLILFGWNVVQVLAAVCVGTAWGSGRAGAEWAMVTDGYLAEAENASLAFASRIPGYVAVNGQTLPVTTRERESGVGTSSSSSSSSSFVARAMDAVSRAFGETRGRFASASSRRRSSDDASASTAAGDAPADDVPATTNDQRSKPVTREERAAAFAAAFERRHDREDGGGGASA